MATTVAKPARPFTGRLADAWREVSVGGSWRPTLLQVALFVVVTAAVGLGIANGTGPDLLAVFTVAACYALLAIGTNVLVGWSGMVTFGQAAFFGCGAYTVALIRNWHWPVEGSLLLAICAAAVLGYVSYWLLSRYTHITFAMLTLVFGQLVYLLVSGSQTLGATDGFGGILREPVFGIDVITDAAFWWLALGVLALGAAASWWLYRRMLALRLFAVREDAGRLETLGYSVRQLRATAGAVSAALCAAGGALFAMYAGAISPTVLQFELSGAALFMCVIGGTGYLWGPLVGATLYTLTVNYWLQSSQSATLYLGAIFVVVMILLPSGVLSIPSRILNLRSTPLRSPLLNLLPRRSDGRNRDSGSRG
jgi:branched-chain amino acid transport system permease protein